MSEAMYHVTEKWYRLYYWMILGFSFLVVVGYVLSQNTQQFSKLETTFGLAPMAVIIATVQIVYFLSVYWLIKKRDLPLATLIGVMFFALMLLHGLTVTDPTLGSWIYVALWITTSMLIGMFGTPTMLASMLLGGIYLALHYDFVFEAVSLPSMVLFVGGIAITTASYGFWRKQLVEPGSLRLNQLSGMLRNKEEQAAILIQSIADGVIVTSTEGKISLMNHAAANMTGWTIEEAEGLDVGLVFKVSKEKGEPIKTEDYPFTAVLAHKAFFNQVLQLESRDGKKMFISLVISPVVTASGEVYGAVAVLRDISQQRAAEQQRAEFISTASHEMRTPVAAIEGYLALSLNDKVSSIDSRARGYLQKAHESTKHLGRLFQDLLTSAKAEDGRLVSHPTAIEMGLFLEQLIEELRFSAQKKGLFSEFIIGSTEAVDATKEGSTVNKMVRPLYYTYADADRLREVITNIFDNAVKYTQQGKVSIGLTGNQNIVQIYVKDTGAGIPADDLPHLFQKFYRVDTSTTRTIGGTGLGLFIARKIIELYSGRIWVESELGKGSTFFINLPRLDNQRAESLMTAPTPAPSVPTNAPKAPAEQRAPVQQQVPAPSATPSVAKV